MGEASIAGTGTWANRFVFAAALQGLLALALTAYLLYYAVFGVAAKIVASGGAGMWLTVGYLGFLILGFIGTAMTASLYRQLESHMGRRYRGWADRLAWGHLVLWSVGVTGATWLMISAGLRGGNAQLPVASGGLGWSALQIHQQIMAAYPPYIAAFIALALLGGFLGGAAFLLTWRRPREASVNARSGEPTIAQ